MSNRKKLTKSTVDSLPTESSERVIWDTEIKGFGLRVSPQGRKTYFLKYRLKGAGALRQRKRVIGQHGKITCEQARLIARRWCGQVAFGNDPHDSAGHREITTIDKLAERYLDEHARVKKRPISVAGDESLLARIILPIFGKKDIKVVSAEDVRKLHHSLRTTPRLANQVRALLSKMFNLAEAWELRQSGTNPCRYVQKYPERRRQRFLSHPEIEALAVELTKREVEAPYMVAFVRLALLTGLRKSELLSLCWSNVNLVSRMIHLSDSKTGARSLPFNEAAFAVLAQIPREENNKFVFVGRKTGQRLVGVQKFWGSVRDAAGIAGVRIHDLRHTFASTAAASGLSLQVIGRLLGHKGVATTERYAHLTDDPAKFASEKVGVTIGAMLGVQPYQRSDDTLVQ